MRFVLVLVVLVVCVVVVVAWLVFVIRFDLIDKPKSILLRFITLGGRSPTRVQL